MATVCTKTIPDGGYVLATVEQICAAWSAYRENRIRLIDLRTWFACFEMKARRCKLKASRIPNYSFEEIHSLVGGAGGGHTRSAIRRLIAAGLLDWSSTAIEIRSGADNSEAMMNHIPNSRRRVPIPRRMLRFLALHATKSLTATVLGHLLRCLYMRAGSCNPRGTCKASWVATVFGVDKRNVKAARRQLVDLGWLQTQTAPQWRLNRFGVATTVNLTWASELPTPDCCHTETSPLELKSATNSSPLESNKELLPEHKNQKPAKPRLNGFWKSGRKNLNSRSAAFHVNEEDMRNIPRLRALHEKAIQQGLANAGEAGELSFMAAAVHARKVASRNAAGLFATIVRKGLWHYVTQQAEDHVRERLRKVSRGKPGSEITPLRVEVEGCLQRIIGSGTVVAAHG